MNNYGASSQNFHISQVGFAGMGDSPTRKTLRDHHANLRSIRAKWPRIAGTRFEYSWLFLFSNSGDLCIRAWPCRSAGGLFERENVKKFDFEYMNRKKCYGARLLQEH